MLPLRCLNRARFFTLNSSLFKAFSTAETPKKEEVSDELIKRELYLGNKVVRLVLNNQKRRNALSLEIMTNLCDELKAIDDIEKVRAVILAAEGPVFSSGHDLKELTSEREWDFHKQVFKKCTELMTLIQAMKLPVIAEVDGVVAAAGTQLVSTCDIVVASKKSTFSVPGLKAGLFCSTPGIPLSRNIPRKLAMYMLLTGQKITAEEALRGGLVSKLVDASEDTRPEAIKIAEDILTMSRSVTALGKAFFYSQIEQNITNAYRQGELVMTENLKMMDAQEGITSFFEKRIPEWTHSTQRVVKK